MDKMFSIYDSKAARYAPPFVAQSGGVAKRMLVDSASDPQQLFARHPGDFTLFLLGDWDDENGILYTLDAKQNLGTVLQLQSVELVDDPLDVPSLDESPAAIKAVMDQMEAS